MVKVSFFISWPERRRSGKRQRQTKKERTEAGRVEDKRNEIMTMHVSCFFTAQKEVLKMLMNLIVFWILSSIFFGSRETNYIVSRLFGVLAFFWIFRLIIGFGFGLLPLIFLILLISKVIMPFCSGFASRWNERL